jgi:hypothetical protein
MVVRVKRTAIAIALALCAAGVAAVPASAKHVHARKVKLEIDTNLSGHYGNTIVEADHCGARFDEDADFTYQAFYKPLKLSLESHAFATGKGRRTVAHGSWHQTGTWYGEDQCGDPAKSDDCTGAVGFNDQLGHGQIAVLVRKKGKVLISPSFGAQTLGELKSTWGNCPSVTGDGGQPYFGLIDALVPWDPVIAKTSITRLAKLKRGETLTLKARPGGTDNSDYNPDTCNNTDGCTGTFDAGAHIFVKRP